MATSGGSFALRRNYDLYMDLLPFLGSSSFSLHVDILIRACYCYVCFGRI